MRSKDKLNGVSKFIDLGIAKIYAGIYGKVFKMEIWAIKLREKYSNTELFLVPVFLYSVRMQENTDQKSLHIWILFTQWYKMASSKRKRKIIILKGLSYENNYRIKFRMLLRLHWIKILNFMDYPETNCSKPK